MVWEADECAFRPASKYAAASINLISKEDTALALLRYNDLMAQEEYMEILWEALICYKLDGTTEINDRVFIAFDEKIDGHNIYIQCDIWIQSFIFV